MVQFKGKSFQKLTIKSEQKSDHYETANDKVATLNRFFIQERKVTFVAWMHKKHSLLAVFIPCSIQKITLFKSLVNFACKASAFQTVKTNENNLLPLVCSKCLVSGFFVRYEGRTLLGLILWILQNVVPSFSSQLKVFYPLSIFDCGRKFHSAFVQVKFSIKKNLLFKRIEVTRAMN